jgi:hypothetical protein
VPDNEFPLKYEIDVTLFEDLVGEEVVRFILAHAPRKVAARFEKALDHFNKAVKLDGIDDEMGAIRLIAAEEELVVAIFEILKLRAEHFPEHTDFVRRYKNHQVKLAFYPVLSQFRFIVNDYFAHGITFDGWEDILHWHLRLVVSGDRIMLQILDKEGKEIIINDPLCANISVDGLDEDAVIDRLCKDLSDTIKDQRGLSVRQFVAERADYRNKLLYAGDAGFTLMGETLRELISIFHQVFHDLVWILAVLLGGTPPSKHWGLVSQFISLYRRVLETSGILKAAGDKSGLASQEARCTIEGGDS